MLLVKLILALVGKYWWWLLWQANIEIVDSYPPSTNISHCTYNSRQIKHSESSTRVLKLEVIHAWVRRAIPHRASNTLSSASYQLSSSSPILFLTQSLLTPELISSEAID